MKSSIYTGHVMHARLEPVKHAFRYPVYFYAIDLDELDSLDRTVWGFGYNRLCPVALHDRDYLDESSRSIREKIARVLGEERMERIARIVLVTSPRYFNYTFSPANFYHCYAADGELFCCVVEVHNTFRERHVYVLDNLEPAPDGCKSASSAKMFHVSPFNNMAGGYGFMFSIAGDAIDIQVTLVRENRPILRARLQGRGQPLTAANMARVILSHPLAGWLTMPRILAQAVRLHFGKKLPVYPKPNPCSPDTIRIAPPTLLQRLAMKQVLNLLMRLECGCLKLVFPDGSEKTCGDSFSQDGVSVRVHNYDFFWRVIIGGDIAFGESYMAGDWECDDLTEVFRFFARSQEAMENKGLPLSWLGRAAKRLQHIARRNSLSGSRRNIAQHYDLSNEFFATFLDRTMTYSCAMFENPSDTLEDAQRNKLRALIRKANIGPTDHVLEIGSGWGSFAIETSRTTGCRVTTLTLSEQQWSLATERIRAAGLQDRIDVQLRDYREMTGQFDRIVAVEMLEAIGVANYGVFFSALERLLKPGGLVVLQVITIPDQRYREYCRSVDFIQTHIFPGGAIPSLTVLCEAMTKHSGLVVEHLENFNQDYARTLREWRERFMQQGERISSLGFSPEFRRKWEYYLSYCEAGFSERLLNLLQIVLTRPGNRSLQTPRDQSA